ncbi:MAG: hypothetical protein AAGI11_15100 [Pseudomonadota bacterium]
MQLDLTETDGCKSKLALQHFESEEFGLVSFTDSKETLRSKPCEPRDITIVSGEDCRALRAEIAVDIRIGQGRNPIGAARNLIY